MIVKRTQAIASLRVCKQQRAQLIVVRDHCPGLTVTGETGLRATDRRWLPAECEAFGCHPNSSGIG